MESDRFDRIVRSLAIARSRRGVLHVLAIGPLAAGLLATVGWDAPAGKGKKKRCQPKCKFCEKCRRGKCKPNKKKDGQSCAEDKVCLVGRCVDTTTCITEGCSDQTQECLDEQCQPICFEGACANDCNFCGVHFLDSGAVKACANSFTFDADPASCTADGDCPPDELCLRFPVTSCTQSPCGTCGIFDACEV